jgi:hypothetical protein
MPVAHARATQMSGTHPDPQSLPRHRKVKPDPDTDLATGVLSHRIIDLHRHDRTRDRSTGRSRPAAAAGRSTTSAECPIRRPELSQQLRYAFGATRGTKHVRESRATLSAVDQRSASPRQNPYNDGSALGGGSVGGWLSDAPVVGPDSFVSSDKAGQRAPRRRELGALEGHTLPR